MRARVLIIVVALGLAVLTVAAMGASEGVYTASTGVRLIPGSEIGPGAVSAWADGTANVKFYWKNYPNNGDIATVVSSSPNYALRAAMANGRSFTFSSGPDSMYVTKGTATEVIVTW